MLLARHGRAAGPQGLLTAGGSSMSAGDVYKVTMRKQCETAAFTSSLWLRQLSGVGPDDEQALSDAIRGPSGYGGAWNEIRGWQTFWTCNKIRKVAGFGNTLRTFYFKQPLFGIPLFVTSPVVLGWFFQLWSGTDQPTGRKWFIESGITAGGTIGGVKTTTSIWQLEAFRTLFLQVLSATPYSWEWVVPRYDRTGYDRVSECLYRVEQVPVTRRTTRSCALANEP